MMASAPKTANLDYLNAYTDQFLEIFKSFPEYYSWFQINGFDGVQSGIGGFLLKPWDERERSQMEILPEVQAKARSPARPADLRFQPAFAARHRRGLPFSS